MALLCLRFKTLLNILVLILLVGNLGCFFNARIYDESKSVSSSFDRVDDVTQPPAVPGPILSGLVNFSWPNEGSSVYGYQTLSGTCTPSSVLDIKYDSISSGYYSSLICDADGRFEIPTYFSGASSLTSVSVYQNGDLAAVRNLNFIQRPNYVANEFDDYIQDIEYADSSKAKFYIAGRFHFYGNVKAPGIIRLNSDGSVDNTFHVNSLQGIVYRIFVHPVTNKVFVFGYFSHINGTLKNSIAVLNTDGTLDTSFTMSAGVQDHGSPGTIKDIAVDNTNMKIYVAGVFDSIYGQTHNCVARINFDGSLDSTFNAGSGCGESGGYLGTANAVEWDPVNSKVYIGGWFYGFGGNSDYGYLARVSSNGTLDLTFSQALGGPNSSPFGIKYDSSLNKVYVVGGFSTYNGAANSGIVRINSDGTADTGFSVGAGFGGVVIPHGVYIDSLSRVVVYGNFQTYKGTSSPLILRILSDGNIDPSWNMLSSVTGVIDASYMKYVYSIIYDEVQNHILIAGAFSAINTTEFSSLAKLSINGALDANFMDIQRPFNGVVKQSAVDPATGDVYVLGDFTKVQGYTRNRIARLNSDGSLDLGFDVGAGFGSASDFSMYFDSTQQKLYVYGSFTTFQAVSRKYIVRLNNDGSYDPTFNIGSSFPSYPSSLSFAFDPINQKIYLSGNFTSFNGTPGLNKLIRLNLDASIDNTLVVGTGFNATPRGVLYAGAGKIFVFGDFSTYQSSPAKQMIRINSDGTRDMSFNFFSGAGCNWSPYIARYDSTQERIYLSFTSTWATCNSIDVGFFTIIDSSGNHDATHDSSTLDNEVWRILGDGMGNVYLTGYFSELSGKKHRGIIKFKSDRSIDVNFKPPESPYYFYSVIKNPIEGSYWFSGQIIDYPNSGYIRLNEDGSFAN